MVQKKQNLSDYDPNHIPKLKNAKVAVVVSEWNTEVTFALRDGAIDTLKKHGVAEDDIVLKYVPGSFELPIAAEMILLNNQEIEGVICLGCVIQGETRHFDFICDATSNGVMNVAINNATPVIFGVLTTNDMQQAIDRSGGKYGNKGVEAAVACLKMIALDRSL
ncbi:MAG: 6,7-dimethyl-8-ribityllumazine synthase [Bacteroidales bacterium]|jgi:6,7-dimethyl-8-ribityllumazine synthase